MSLATRCTSCKTVFRVVQDQLKVSEGWVRCGRCGTVFNALEALFDLERDTPARWQTSQAGGLGGSKKSRESSRSKPTRDREAPAPSSKAVKSKESSRASPLKRSPTPEKPFFARRRSDGSIATGPESKPRGHDDFADAQFDADVVAHAPDPEVTQPLPLKPQRAEPTVDPHAETIIAGMESPSNDVGDDYEPATLEFVRMAERQAQWQSPRMRAMLISASVVLAAVLSLQVMNHYRDITAARWPQMAPMLVRWCQIVQCQVQAPRSIDSVVVESTTLARKPNTTDSFLLSVVLRNQSHFAVAMPSLDLSLRDASGLLITRRMLHPLDLQTKTTVLEPDAETQLQVQLSDKEQRIVGYTVEAFYP